MTDPYVGLRVLSGRPQDLIAIAELRESVRHVVDRNQRREIDLYAALLDVLVVPDADRVDAQADRGDRREPRRLRTRPWPPNRPCAVTIPSVLGRQ
jgi:hypothetical protein